MATFTPEHIAAIRKLRTEPLKFADPKDAKPQPGLVVAGHDADVISCELDGVELKNCAYVADIGNKAVECFVVGDDGSLATNESCTEILRVRYVGSDLRVIRYITEQVPTDGN